MLSRDDLTAWLTRLTPPDDTYVASFGAAYDSDIRVLEAALRPLWGHLPAAAGSSRPFKEDPVIQHFYDIVQHRQLPPVDRSRRQIVVETGPISYFLGFWGDQLAADLGPADMAYLVQWLNTMNTIPLPPGNWYFFIVLLNAALRKQGYAYDQHVLANALAQLDTFYLGDGVYSDGPTQQMDYYLAFAFHFYGLLYAQLTDDDHARVFRKRSQDFADRFIYWFDESGRSIPFGRSLTYRFAPIGFWCQFYLSGAYRGTSFTPAVIKGLIDRAAHYWQQQPITSLTGQGPLTVGYGYNNYLLSEDYNAPGSPMWAFKLFGILQLPATDPYWQLPTAPYPADLPGLSPQPASGMLFRIAPGAGHHVFLSSKQMPAHAALYHGQEKYGKFAYSSHFGFNLSRDLTGIETFAIDNTLAFSIPDQDQYAGRKVITASHMAADYAVNTWHTGTARVISYLVPLTANLHVRIHEVTTKQPLISYEGGFPLAPWNPKHQKPVTVGTVTIATNANGESAIIDLLNNRQAAAVNQGPNTNLLSPEKNIVPVLTTPLAPGTTVLACAVVGDPQGCTRVDGLVQFLTTATGYAIVTQEQTIDVPRWSPSVKD